MSRSYKNTMCFKHNVKWAKKAANKKVRRAKSMISSGGAFKKIYCRYNIFDYKVFSSFEEYKAYSRRYEQRYGLERASNKELYNEWYKVYKMK